ncbi:MAG: hypothetical protein FJZ00_09720 [Candidatus Sericytochromatia bacterium]|uniref:Uncharacterized protein n=1 Tax=Candidatus Tanganyikabacteria bacterium TaxID=2961651 RepID=A0A938BLL3_9BACT|nr:hypothetical protein [Candidatus Tanganyikabacteria bacterium]
MGQIQEAGSAAARAASVAVGKAKDAQGDISIDSKKAETPGAVLIPDKAIFKKRIYWSPEDSARFHLDHADARINGNLKLLEWAITERSKGKTIWESFNDPVLKKMTAARTELQRAKADLAAARKALDGEFPYWKLANAKLGPHFFARTPDLARAEAKISSALAHVEKSEYLITNAISHLPDHSSYKGALEAKVSEGKGGAATEVAREAKQRPIDGESGSVIKCWPPFPDREPIRDQLERLLGSVGETRAEIESARRNIWEAQQNTGPERPFPSPLPRPWPEPRPTPRDWPPFYYDKIPNRTEDAIVGSPAKEPDPRI